MITIFVNLLVNVHYLLLLLSANLLNWVTVFNNGSSCLWLQGYLALPCVFTIIFLVIFLARYMMLHGLIPNVPVLFYCVKKKLKAKFKTG